MLRLLIVLTIVLIPLDILACGMFFPSVTASPTTMDTQRVLMVWKKDTIDVHVSVRANSENADFAWVLPVADNPELSLGNIATLDALDELTKPRIEIASELTGSGPTESTFCGTKMAASGAELGASGNSAPIDVESGTLGDYEYDIVKAETVEEMISWLEEDGYAIPEGTEETLAPYVAASMSFVWVKLSAAATAETLTDLQPLVFTIPRNVSSKTSFPLALSAGSSTGVMSTQLYTLSDKRYRVTNYPSTDLQGVADRLWDLRFEFESYEEVIDTMTEEAGGRLMVTELAGDIRNMVDTHPAISELIDDDTYYLTRILARTKPENLVDATITYANEAPDVSNLAISKAPDSEDKASLPFAVLCVLLGLIGWRRKRKPATT